MSVQSPRLFDYAYILATIALGVYGQLVLKWQISSGGPMPSGGRELVLAVVRLTANPWVISSFVAAFLAACTWMAALSRFDLSYAYPFTSLTFVLILALSAVIFREPVTWTRLTGVAFIMLGLYIGSR